MDRTSNEPISDQWYQAANRWVDAESAANLLEETRSAIFSQMTLRQTASSVAARELMARGSDDWMNHVQKIADARRHANKLKIECDFLKMKYFEAAGQAATERTMARL